MSSPTPVSRWSECPVCGSDEREPFVERAEFTFVRCSCDLVYKSRDQTPTSKRPHVLWNERYARRRRHRVAKSRRQILDLLNHVESGPLLDVGCSLGYSLQATTELGLEAKGGGLFVAVPNLEFYLAVRSPETHHFFAHGGTQHYVYYAARHMIRLLGKEGFRTVRVHPHLWQRRASLPWQVGNLLALPLRAIGGPLRTRLGPRRELWLVAVRRGS